MRTEMAAPDFALSLIVGTFTYTSMLAESLIGTYIVRPVKVEVAYASLPVERSFVVVCSTPAESLYLRVTFETDVAASFGTLILSSCTVNEELAVEKLNFPTCTIELPAITLLLTGVPASRATVSVPEPAIVMVWRFTSGVPIVTDEPVTAPEPPVVESRVAIHGPAFAPDLTFA